MARSARLSRATVVDAALRVLERDGIDAVTFRRLATELRAAPMSLYRHVRNQSDLWQAMIDSAGPADDVLAVDDVGAPWQQRYRTVLLAFYDRAHRERELVAVGTRLGIRPAWETTLGERLCEILVAGRMEPAAAVSVARFSTMSMMSLVHAANWGYLPVDERWRAARKAAVDASKQLPAEAFPVLRAAAASALPPSRRALAEEFADFAVRAAEGIGWR